MGYDCPADFIFDPFPNYTIISGTPVTRAVSKATTLSPQRASLTNLRLGIHFKHHQISFKMLPNLHLLLKQDMYLTFLCNSKLSQIIQLICIT